MIKALTLVIIFAILLSSLISQSLMVSSGPVYAHQSGCHRYHSCPSDTGSYVCGDLGYDSQCPGKEHKTSKNDNPKNPSKSTDKSTTKSDKKVRTSHPQSNSLTMKQTYSLVSSWGYSGTGDGQMIEPSDFSIDKVRNTVYVADKDNNRIQKFELDGKDRKSVV